MTTSPSGQSEFCRPTRTWLRLGVVSVGLAFVLGLGLGLRNPDVGSKPPDPAAFHLPSDPEQSWMNPLSPAYLGDEGCATCHAEEAKRHRGSGHSRTLLARDLALAFPDLAGREENDPEREGQIRFVRQGNDLVAEYRNGSTVESLPIQFAVGSGAHAVTFLTLLSSPDDAPKGLEHRFSLFDQGKILALTPSHRREEVREPMERFGRLHHGRDAQGCLGCHSVTGQIQGTTVDDLRPGVGCESCHGPGREHAASMTEGGEASTLLFAKGQTSALAEVRMCGRCHRLPEMIVPPEPISEPKLARFQPVGLLNSACFQKARGQLRCTTCHDPHAATERDPAYYAAICLKCHSTGVPQARICPQSAQDRCVECHMPPVEVHPHIAFHDHWIRVRSDQADETREKRRP